MNRPNLMSVQPEVVKEVLVGRMVERIEERAAQPPEGPLVAALAATGQDPGMVRAGYELRAVERELFEPARTPAPELEEKLAGAEDPLEAATTLSRELSEAEPLDKPRPDDTNAASWRVPGPGGHVRHFVAEAVIERQVGGGRPELKRAFIYGFFLRCCEEALPD